MESKKINQLATAMSPSSTDLTIIGDPISGVSKKATLQQIASLFGSAVSFYANLAAFPATGTIDTLYCAKDTYKLYIWSGSAYVQTFPSQTLLDTYQLKSEKGASNGYASLDSSGKVPISQLPSSIMEYKGMWNASTNTPTLANGTGDTGDVYICNVAGTVNFGAGNITFAVGDYVVYSGTIWQRSSGAVGTVTSVAVTETGDALTITGSPVTTSGTINIGFAGTSAQYVAGDGSLVTFPSLTGYVPYTGATGNVNLGTHSLTAYDLIINHSSGSGVAASITKGGSGEALTVTKSSGSGNAASITGGVTLLETLHLTNALTDTYIASAATWNAKQNAITLTTTGTSGAATLIGNTLNIPNYSPDLSGYVTLTTAQSISGAKTFSNNVKIDGGSSGLFLGFKQYGSSSTGTSGFTSIYAYGSDRLGISFGAGNDIQFATASPTNPRLYTFPDASGTVALTSDIPSLTGYITGTGTSGYIPYFNGTSSVTGTSNLFWDNTNKFLGIGTNAPSAGVTSYSTTAATQFKAAGTAPAFTFSNTLTSPSYGCVFGLATANGHFVTGTVAGDMAIANQSTTAGAIVFGTGTTEKMRMTAAGTFSIGNTNSTYTLDVSGTGRFTGALTGTSATFSDNLVVGSFVYAGNAAALQVYYETNGSASNAVWYQSAGNSYNLGYRSSGSFGSTTGLNPVITWNTSGNVGIGTTSPNKNLHIKSTNGNATAQLQLQSTGTVKGYFGVFSDTIYINSGGTYNSGWSLDGAFGVAAIELNSFDGGSQILFSTINSNTTPTERMRITSGGNVGIGTSSPTETLTLAGSARITGQASNFGTGTRGVNIDVITSSGNGRIYMVDGTGTAGDLLLGTASTERMRITSGGQLGLGVVPQTWWSSRKAIEVFNGGAYAGVNAGWLEMWGNSYLDSAAATKYLQNGYATLLQSGNTADGGYTFLVAPSGTAGATISFVEGMRINAARRTSITGGTANSSDFALVVNNANPTNIFLARNDGLITIPYLQSTWTTSNAANVWANPSSGDIYRSTSSIKYKKNVKDYARGLAEVMQLRPVSYEGKGVIDEGKTFAGLIAEDVHELGLTEFVQYAEDGTPDALAYQNMIALAFKAIQELNEKIKQLENK